MVNINIQKKDLWLLSAIIVFLVGVVFVIAIDSNNYTIHGHDAGEIEFSLNEYSGILTTNDNYQYISCGPEEYPITCGTESAVWTNFQDSVGCNLDIANRRCTFWRDIVDPSDTIEGFCYCK